MEPKPAEKQETQQDFLKHFFYIDSQTNHEYMPSCGLDATLLGEDIV